MRWMVFNSHPLFELSLSGKTRSEMRMFIAKPANSLHRHWFSFWQLFLLGRHVVRMEDEEL